MNDQIIYSIENKINSLIRAGYSKKSITELMVDFLEYEIKYLEYALNYLQENF